MEEHRISGEGITKQQKTEPGFQEEQIQVKIVTPRKFLTEQSFEKKEEKQKRRSEQPTKEERFQAIMERLIHDIELKERKEGRYRRLDEAIRRHQQSRKMVAATQENRKKKK